MEPARTIVAKLHGPSAVAAAIGIHRTRVSNWMRPKNKGGTGGTVPSKYHQRLLEIARERGADLSPDDFFLPREDAA